MLVHTSNTWIIYVDIFKKLADNYLSFAVIMYTSANFVAPHYEWDRFLTNIGGTAAKRALNKPPRDMFPSRTELSELLKGVWTCLAQRRLSLAAQRARSTHRVCIAACAEVRLWDSTNF